MELLLDLLEHRATADDAAEALAQLPAGLVLPALFERVHDPRDAARVRASLRRVFGSDPGRRTEVVCLFDVRKRAREMESCTRSFHVFRDRREKLPATSFATRRTPP